MHGVLPAGLTAVNNMATIDLWHVWYIIQLQQSKQ